MPDDYGTLNTILAIIGAWGVIFFGVWATPLSIQQKYIVDFGNTFLFIMFGIMYFDFKGKIPIGKEMRRRIWFWFGVGVELFQGATMFLVTIATWKVVVISGYEVVTYDNLISLLFSIMGVLVIVYAAYRIKNREEIMAHMSLVRARLF
jgi:hypothetical protein